MAMFLLLCSLCHLQVGLCYSSSDSLMLSPVETTKQTGSAAKFSGYSPSTLSESETVEQWFLFLLDVFGQMVQEWAAVALSLLSRQWAIPLDVCCVTFFFLSPPFFFFLVKVYMYSGVVRVHLCSTRSLKKLMWVNRKCWRSMFYCSQGDKSRLSWNPRGEYFQVDFK